VGSEMCIRDRSQTPPEESNSALATLSLIRSIGTTIAPAFLVGFLAHAGTELADNLTAQLPSQISAPALPYAAELQTKFNELKSDPELKDKLKNVEFPDLNSQTTINIDTTSSSGATLPDDLVELLKTADVTNIVERSKVVAERQFATQTPSVIADITNGVNTGLDSLSTTSADLSTAEKKLTKAITGVSSGIDGMNKAATGMRSGIAGMTKAITGMDAALAGMAKGVDGAGQGVSGLQAQIDQTTAQLATAQAELADLNTQLAALDPTDPQFPTLQAALQGQIAAKTGQIGGYQGQLVGLNAALDQASGKLTDLKQQRATLAAQRAALAAQRATLSSQLATIETKLSSAKTSRSDLISARNQLVTAQADLADTSRKLTVLRDAVPGAFDTAKSNYLAEIDARGPQLEQTFVHTLNTGFFGIFSASAVSAVVALLLLLGYPRRRPSAEVGQPATAQEASV
jgi:peptidoglycan hydrolase CwlO-like protein